MTAKEMWERFSREMGIDDVFDAWAFGDASDELADLVCRGIKTGTSSAYPLYALEGEPIPEAGDYSVILNSREEAVCIIRNRAVTVLPYKAVTEEMAFKEGEGDRTLAYWRQVHERFFISCMEENGLSFDEEMLVVYEEFERVYG